MKILLIGINSKFIHSNLAIRYLKAYSTKHIKDDNFICETIEFSINDRRERVVEEIVRTKPDIIAFSCYIWNIEFVTGAAKLIRLIDENIEILYGGPEVTYDCKDFLSNNVGEYVIEGEGEVTFKEFVEYKLNIRKIDAITGLYYRKDNNIIFNGPRELMDMEDLVFPYKENEDLDNKIVYYEGSRGCPFKCKYCLSSTIHGVRFLKTERVKKELQFLIDKKISLIKFVDRTFNCNSLFAKEIWSFVIQADTNATFHFEISADLLNDEEIKILSMAPKGRIQFEVGVQTTNNTVLKNIDRNVNFRAINEKVNEISKLKNINQHLDLIAGLPDEDFESFRNSFNDVYSTKPAMLQLGFLKLLKGSLMRKEVKKWGMIYSPFPPYEIISTSKISYEAIILLKRVEEMVDKYYNSGKFTNILKFLINACDKNSAFDFFLSLGNYFFKIGNFSRNISSQDYYKVFIDFYNERLILNPALQDIINKDALLEIVKFDYLSFNKKKWLPPFLKRYDIGKETELKLYDELISSGRIDSKKDFHIEKFNLNIEDYLESGAIKHEVNYVVFNEKTNEILSDVGLATIY